MTQSLDETNLRRLRNVGPATLRDFAALGIGSVRQLADCDADLLYQQLSRVTGQRQDPCVRDVFAAAIHQARTGEATDWWQWSAERKRRQTAERGD